MTRKHAGDDFPAPAGQQTLSLGFDLGKVGAEPTSRWLMLAKSFIVPFMEYAASERWRFPFAPHDLGQYPHANGQRYGGGERSEENQMPVEECGNLLLLFGAVAQMEGNTDFAGLYWTQLSQWADYLKDKGFAERWAKEAADGAHYRLAFDRPGTWSQKYNLVWDKILGLGLFPDVVRRKEMDHYLRVQNEFGLPLDNRRDYTKLDWVL